MAISARGVWVAAFLVAANPALADSRTRPPADCSVGAIADTPVIGTVNGVAFVPKEITVHVTKDAMELNDAKFDKYELALMTDGIFNALSVGMLVPLGKSPAGRVFRALAVDSIGAQPAAAQGLPEIQNWDLELEAADVDTSFTQDVAAIRVEWGTLKGGTLSGKIHFCVPSAKAEIAGSFTAKIQ
ncbi:MAG: hypothetical protein WDN08_10960 [Rhizomicrobium sp.]